MAEATTVQITFLGGAAVEVTNGRAQVKVHGNPEGESWMPTELFLAGLGSCMLATLAYAAQVRGVNVTGASVCVTGETVKNPTRFGSIRVTYELPDSLTANDSSALIRAAGRCKVHNTLAQAPHVEVSE